MDLACGPWTRTLVFTVSRSCRPGPIEAQTRHMVAHGVDTCLGRPGLDRQNLAQIQP
jgi:hypothetical protein